MFVSFPELPTAINMGKKPARRNAHSTRARNSSCRADKLSVTAGNREGDISGKHRKLQEKDMVLGFDYSANFRLVLSYCRRSDWYQNKNDSKYCDGK